MYESPINIMFRGIETQIVQRDEQMIFEAIQKQNVFIDKEELIKAINYDRNQYSKGYKDGANDMLDKIKNEIEEMPKTYPFVNHLHTYVRDEDVRKILDKYKAEGEAQDEGNN